MRVAIAWIGTLLSCAIAVLVLFANAMKTAPHLSVIDAVIAGAAPACFGLLLGTAAARAVKNASGPRQSSVSSPAAHEPRHASVGRLQHRHALKSRWTASISHPQVDCLS